jgi:hypothetical protein
MTSRGVTIDVGTRLRRLSSLWRWRPRVGKLRRVLGQSRSRRLWRLRKPPGVLFCGVRVVRGLIVLSTLIDERHPHACSRLKPPVTKVDAKPDTGISVRKYRNAAEGPG